MKIIEIISPFLIGRYEKLKNDIEYFFKDIYVTDFYQLDIHEVFFKDLIEYVKNENKILTILFVKNNFNNIYNLLYPLTDK